MGKIDLDNDVQSLDFGSKSDTRIQINLDRYQIKTIRELCRCNIVELKKIKDLGKASIREINETLKAHGLQLGMSDDQLDEYASSLSLEDAKWEQRRYEIEKEIFLHYLFNDEVSELDYDGLTAMSVSIANSFIVTYKSMK
jgi:hypothetical protein